MDKYLILIVRIKFCKVFESLDNKKNKPFKAGIQIFFDLIIGMVYIQIKPIFTIIDPQSYLI